MKDMEKVLVPMELLHSVRDVQDLLQCITVCIPPPLKIHVTAVVLCPTGLKQYSSETCYLSEYANWMYLLYELAETIDEEFRDNELFKFFNVKLVFEPYKISI